MRRTRSRRSKAAAAFAVPSSVLLSTQTQTCRGFSPIVTRFKFNCPVHRDRPSWLSRSPIYVFAPPGSGYVRSDVSNEDESSLSHPELTSDDIMQISPPAFPSTYKPMLEYPGTMRPGRTPENMPYHDLPGLGVNDPDPVPWPHFQEIEWHHRWDPPHEQALAMEEFIEVQGRWASVADEAEMRMGMRRGVRERREAEEMGRGGIGGSGEQTVIMDDEEEEEGDSDSSAIGIGLGDGVEALLNFGAQDTSKMDEHEEDDQGDDDHEDGDEFLIDLGLGGDGIEEETGESTKKTMDVDSSLTDNELDKEANLDLDYELGFNLGGDEDEDDMDGVNENFDDYVDEE